MDNLNTLTISKCVYFVCFWLKKININNFEVSIENLCKFGYDN